LAEQSAVVGRAERFIGTYGGFAYLAPLLGISGLSVYSDIGRIVPMHMDVAFRVFREFACGSLEKGRKPSTVGYCPTARFAAIHVDQFCEFALSSAGGE
jgi:hypothetical protein